MFDQNELDDLYNCMGQAAEQRKRENFNVFMTSLVTGLEKDLNKEFASGDQEEYEKLLNNVKKQGFRVLRNSQGVHKIKL